MLLFFFSQLIFNQNIAQETNKVATFKGWNDLIWGCSETDVKQKYGGQLTILETAGKYGVMVNIIALLKSKIMRLAFIKISLFHFFLKQRQRNWLR